MALNKFCQKHPHANISITIKSRRELLHWERGEHFDVALASLPFEQRVFRKIKRPRSKTSNDRII